LPQQIPLSSGADKHLDRGKDAHTRGAVWWLYANDDNDDYTQTTVKISLSLDCEENMLHRQLTQQNNKSLN